MTAQNFPALKDSTYTETRDAIHAYSRVLGDWLKQCSLKRKHWWHASLRPSLNGLTPGIIHSDIDFELELNLSDSLLQLKTSSGKHFRKIARAICGRTG